MGQRKTGNGVFRSGGYKEMQTEINPIACAGEILKEAQRVCDDFGLHSLKPTIKSINNFAEQNHYLDYAVLGQFKVGKSSFLNSFIGQPLLPVGNIPVTSVITRLRFGTKKRLRLFS
ncbi:MAG: dynamin family protein [Methanosarcina sp.]|nr:dynamin family protein [Methanosarcina sp.]